MSFVLPRLWLRLSALLALMLLVSGCSVLGGSDESPTPVASGVSDQQSAGTAAVAPSGSPAARATKAANIQAPSQLVEGGIVEPRTLNPVLVADPISEELSHLVFNGLVVVDPESGKPTGDLAASWDVSEDGTTYTFHLRDGITWSDGKPFGAQDVVFTYKLMMNDRARSPRYSRLVERVRDVRAPDLKTVVVSLIHSDATFLATQATYGIVPEHVLASVLPEELVTDPFGISSTVGTGPFTLEGWARGEQVAFRRNERSFKPPAAYERYVYRVVADQQALVAGLADGSIDWATLDPTAVDAAKQRDVRVVSLPGFELSMVALQLDGTKSKLFLDPRLRQALMLALDRSKLVSDIWHGQAQVANGTIPPASWAYAESKTTYRQNLDEARRLLQEAGWVSGDDGIRAKDGTRLRFKVLTNGDNPVRQQTVNWLIESWRAIGVEAVPDFEKASTVQRQALGSGDFEALLFGVRLEVDPDQSALWSSDSFYDAFNVEHYANADVDKLLEQALGGKDANERKQQYGQIQDQVMHDLPVLPLAFPDVTVGLSRRLHGVNVTAILIRNRANIEQWVPSSDG